MTVFVDSSAFYAAADTDDVNHEHAISLLSADAAELKTSTLVLAESWALLNLRLGRGAAQAFWGAVRDGAADVVALGAADLERAWHIADVFQDQDFSLVDMTSFALMERLGLTRVATFDHHFAVYRYGPRRDRAFEIAR
jgi:predicted nucleic acid-binding protein